MKMQIEALRSKLEAEMGRLRDEIGRLLAEISRLNRLIHALEAQHAADLASLENEIRAQAAAEVVYLTSFMEKKVNSHAETASKAEDRADMHRAEKAKAEAALAAASDALSMARSEAQSAHSKIELN